MWDVRNGKSDVGNEDFESLHPISHFPHGIMIKKNWIGSREMGNGIQMRILTTEVSTSDLCSSAFLYAAAPVFCAHHVSTFGQEAFNYSQRYSLFSAKARFGGRRCQTTRDGGMGAGAVMQNRCLLASAVFGQRGSFSVFGRQIAASPGFCISVRYLRRDCWWSDEDFTVSPYSYKMC